MISVIVPVYNVEKHIHRCINSILSQSFTNFELILVDDGSSDSCGRICDDYKTKDRRVHVIHKNNGGLSDARNYGLDWAFNNSNSKWITFIDSDDWIVDNYLEILYNAAYLNKTRISSCTYKPTHGEKIDKGNAIIKVLYSEDFYCQQTTYSISACFKLYEKSLFSNIRFPVGRLSEDTFTTYKVLFSVDRIAFVDLPLYAYYLRNNSIMRSKWSVRQLDALEAYNNQIHFFEEKGYMRAYKCAISMYANTIFDQISVCKNFGSTDENAQKILKKILRKHIHKYRPRGYLPISKYAYIYELVYPKYVKFYRYKLAAKNKLKKLLRAKR